MESEDQPIPRDMYHLLTYLCKTLDQEEAIQMMRDELQQRGYSPEFIETMEITAFSVGYATVATAGYYN